VRPLLAALVLVGAVLLGGSGSAVAHNELIGSDPADGATVASSPARVALRFNLPVQPGFSTVTVTGPRETQWQVGAAAEDGATVTTQLRPLGSAGEYTVAYQVLSADGHPVRGAIRFTLASPGPGIAAAQNQSSAPAPDPTGSAARSAATQTEAAGPPVWPWLVGGAVLLVVGLLVVLRGYGQRR
jgi:methionine-rich copper-binding protein CopC